LGFGKFLYYIYEGRAKRKGIYKKRPARSIQPRKRKQRAKEIPVLAERQRNSLPTAYIIYKRIG